MSGMEMAGYRILVVDGDSQSRELAYQFLCRLGATQISEAESGRDAMALLEPAPHIVLTEIDTGAISGIQLLQHIRSQPEPLRNAAVIILTGQGSGDIVKVALESGADGFIVKPFTQETLVTRCFEALKRANTRRKRAV